VSFRPIADFREFRQTATVRPVITIVALMFFAGCTAKQPSSGWQYDRGPYAIPLRYSFDDPEHTDFVGICIPKRSFSIVGGAWNGDQFTLTVDDNSWTLPTWQGEEGHSLPVELDTQVKAIASAKRHIVFQVGNWRREIKPEPVLAMFAVDCSSGKLGKAVAR